MRNTGATGVTECRGQVSLQEGENHRNIRVAGVHESQEPKNKTEAIRFTQKHTQDSNGHTKTHTEVLGGLLYMAHIRTQENRSHSAYTKTQESQELKDSQQGTGNICRAHSANKRTHETHSRRSSHKNTGYKGAAALTHEHRKHRVQRAH